MKRSQSEAATTDEVSMADWRKVLGAKRKVETPQEIGTCTVMGSSPTLLRI